MRAPPSVFGLGLGIFAMACYGISLLFHPPEYRWAVGELEKHQQKLERDFGGVMSVDEMLAAVTAAGGDKQAKAVEMARLLDQKRRSGRGAYEAWCRDSVGAWRKF